MPSLERERMGLSSDPETSLSIDTKKWELKRPQTTDEIFADMKDLPHKFVQREEWGALDYKRKTVLNTPVNKVVLNWTETEPCTWEQECIIRVKEIQKKHLAAGEYDIRHNFLIGGDGALYIGRGYETVGPEYGPLPQAEKLYSNSIDLAFIDVCRNKPTPLMMKALSEFVAIGIDRKYIAPRYEFYWLSKNNVIYIQPCMLPE